MGNNDLCITVPSFFRCPISLDVMKSPVSLSTGVTYDRSSIQRWLDSGHNTCPATMQVLDSKDFVPNLTLHRLIQIWSHTNHHHRHQQQPTPNFNHSLSSAQVLDLLNRVQLSTHTGFETFLKILCFASQSPENRKFLASNKSFVTCLAELIALDGTEVDPDLLEAVLKIFQLVSTTFDSQRKENVFSSNPNLITSLSKILNNAPSDSRVAVFGILESIASDPESKKAVFDNGDMLDNILKTLRLADKNDAAEMHAVLSALISLTTPRRNKIKLVRAGGVPIIRSKIDAYDTDRNTSTNANTIELLLTLLEMLVGCTEGRAAITEDTNCLPGVVQKIMKVSREGNEHAVAVLWSMCYLFRDQKAREVVTKSNGGLTKILLLMQSDCSPAVKRMCSDLLRIFRVNSKSCLSSYDTKTTHIMPC